jgi:hypothetical protein
MLAYSMGFFLVFAPASRSFYTVGILEMLITRPGNMLNNKKSTLTYRSFASAFFLILVTNLR